MMPQLNAALPIVFDDGTMQQPFRQQMDTLNNALPLLGDGSPEGIVSAPIYTLYIDRLGTAGAIEYRKMLPDVGGDKTQGWLAV